VKNILLTMFTEQWCMRLNYEPKKVQFYKTVNREQ